MHINLHKTFSTPHGGGGPGSGPVVLSEALCPFGPLPYTARYADGSVKLIEEEDAEEAMPQSFGRMTAFHGQMGMFTRALSYILSHGADGLRQVAEDAVLNANYILRSLEDVLDAPFAFSGPCMHEAIFSDKGFADGVTTLDLAKALIDEGFHPMTMYFPLVVHGAMLVEPTETESKAGLDQFIIALRSIAERARAGDESLKAAPGPRPAAPPRRDAGGAKAGARLQDAGARWGGGEWRGDGDGRWRISRFYEGPAGGAKRSAPAALRNREPIAEVLEEWLPASGLVLEIASGSGEHAVHFARRFPEARLAAERRRSRRARSRSRPGGRCGASPMSARRSCSTPPRPTGRSTRADAVLSINMVHISPWASALGLIDGAARLLRRAAPLILYGPWLKDDIETAPSNLDFDADLKRRNPEWGLRRVEDFAAAARRPA